MDAIGQGLDLLAQWPLLALAVGISALVAAIKQAGGLDKSNAGRWLLPLLPLFLGALGGIALRRADLGIAGAAVVGLAVGALSGQVYAAIKRIVPGKDPAGK